MDFDTTKSVLWKSLIKLLKHDRILLKNDVSERAITHRLAIYLEHEIRESDDRLTSGLDVDCEYNRDVTRGLHAAKILEQLQDDAQKKRKDLVANDASEDEVLSVSTYPDIIVHRRGTNDNNFLIAEVKKARKGLDASHDEAKLKAFTEQNGPNEFRYNFGVFIQIPVKPEKGMQLTIEQFECRWFRDGQIISDVS